MTEHTSKIAVALAIVSALLIAEGITFEVTLQPTLPLIPICAFAIGLFGFWYAGKMCE